MRTSTGTVHTIGLDFERSNLYPPLHSTGSAVVGFTTILPADEDVDFSLVANGDPGLPSGIQLRPGSSAGGTLWIQPNFIHDHTGSWPVQLLLQASRDGVIVDDATLWLHDTRQMQVSRILADLAPNPAHVSDDDVLLVAVRITFQDVDGIELPRDEVTWSVTLPDTPPGLEVDGTHIRVAPGSSSGDFQVRIAEASGVERTLVLTLLPPLDIGLELSQYDLYPPLRSDQPASVGFTTSLPPDASLLYSYQLNGQGGHHDGIYLQSIGDYWGLLFTKEFIARYNGSWPARIDVRALLDGQLAGMRTLELHDTRSMVCTRVDFEFRPSDSISIPDEGQIVVTAAPRFFDASDVLLPHVELDWDAALDGEPIAGIERHKHALLISPDASPGEHKVTILGPGGLEQSRLLTLTRREVEGRVAVMTPALHTKV